MITKADLRNEVERLRLAEHKANIALNAMAEGEILTVGKAGHYTVKLAGIQRAEGGVVLIRFAPPGQKPYTSVEMFDVWGKWVREAAGFSNDTELHALRGLAERATVIASNILNQAEAA